MRQGYDKQVRLLLKVLPVLSVTDVFALKGGTAINFFVRDFPRLSVDIDLTYLPLKNRSDSLEEINTGVLRIALELEKQMPGVLITRQKSGGSFNKLIIRTNDAQVKIEVNTVLRGAIHGAKVLELSQALQKEFELYAAVKTLSFEDLYGGKLCAALDRQHPRDLFDVSLLFKNEGLTEGVRKAFIGYLVSHSRPIHELLNPNLIPIEAVYHKEFSGMTNEGGNLQQLMEIQRTLPKIILNDMTAKEKEFLLSFKKGKPVWELIELPVLKDLPGVQWKLHNLSKMDKQKHRIEFEKLEQVLTNF